MATDAFQRSKLARGVTARARASAPTIVDVIRRALDVSVSLVSLVILAPVFLVVAVLVKFDSSGPVLFRQKRIGRNRRSRVNAEERAWSGVERRSESLFGEPFTLYKFRTMYADARERYPELYSYCYSEEELRTLPIKVLVADKAAALLGSDGNGVGRDPRVTRIGHWLRRTSLDELPNLLNVLKGDMHLVGPRPDIAANIRYYKPNALEILDVKPGITGLAQIRGRGLLTFDETNACDLEYARHRSLILDLRILMGTIPALLNGRGAY